MTHLSLTHRPRRLRSSEALRGLTRETQLSRNDLILPLFISEKISAPTAVASMPGVFQLTEPALIEEALAAHAEGIPAILLFGIPSHKDAQASQAYSPSGVVQRAVRALKKACPGLIIITDVCLCEFMSHGHCGVTHFDGDRQHIVSIDNDASVELLCKTAISHAEAGADIVAPSDMMDGRIGAMRKGLDQHGFQNTPILSYAAKFASAFYGPFRDAAESTPQAGDRKSYQMDSANGAEALREVALDVEEGADMVMVKPGMPYLDIIWRVKQRFQMPTVAYQVSGEYSMLKAAALNGWIDERSCMMEAMTAFRRAGADLIVTYAARQVARWLTLE